MIFECSTEWPRSHKRDSKSTKSTRLWWSSSEIHHFIFWFCCFHCANIHSLETFLPTTRKTSSQKQSRRSSSLVYSQAAYLLHVGCWDIFFLSCIFLSLLTNLFRTLLVIVQWHLNLVVVNIREHSNKQTKSDESTLNSYWREIERWASFSISIDCCQQARD